MKLLLPIIFAVMTGLFWGTYGPAVGLAREALPGDKSPFKPYLMIGLAYLVWGVIGGAVAMRATGATFTYNGGQATWGFIAGSLGAFGALSLTIAMFSGGMAMPQVVMPIVFGTAVSVSAIVATLTIKNVEVNPMLYVGIVGMAICIVIVAYFTPHPKKHGPPPTPAAQVTTPSSSHQA